MSFTADANRISLPRGKVFLARKSSASVMGAFLFAGNVSKLDFATIGDDIEEVTDFTSATATPLTRISKKRAPEFNLSLKEANPDNLSLLFMGAVSDYTQAATPIVGEVLGAAGVGGIKVGGIYRTAKPKIDTIQGVDSGAHELVVTTNYVIRSAEAGIIEVVALPSGAVEGDILTIDYTPTLISTTPLKKITGGDQARIEGALLYIGTGSQGPRHKLEIWNCAFTSDGAVPFIATDSVEFGLKVTVLADANHSDLFELLELDTGA